MTIGNSIAASGPYFPNGATTVFPFEVDVDSGQDLAVVWVSTDGSEAVVPSGSYSVTISGSAPGGSITFASAPTIPNVGDELWIVLNPTFEQEARYSDEGPFNQSLLEGTFDAQARLSIWLRERVLRGFSVPFGETVPSLPAASARAGKFLAFDAGGMPVPASGTGADPDLRADLGAAGGSALVGFLQAGTGADPETLQAAVRREVWADQFRLDSDADDRDCITRAIAAVAAANGGGVVRLSRRSYTFNGPLVITAINNVRLVGAGNSPAGTMIRETFTSGDAVTFNNCQSCEISGVQFWPTVRKTSGYSVKLGEASFACFVDIRTDYGWNGLYIAGATETRYRIITRYMLGSIGVLFGGSLTYPSFRCVCEWQISDNPWPSAVVANAANRKTFSGGMSLVAGDHFEANGGIWQCVQGGTAGGSAPNYPAGTTPESVFTTDVASGTALLRFVCNANLTHLIQDSYAYSLLISAAALLNGNRGFAMLDNANTGTSYPVWAFVINLECDNNLAIAVDLDRGEGFYAPGTFWVGSCKIGNGLRIGPNYRGSVALGSGSRIMGNAQHGILREAGAVDVRFVGIEAADNSAEAVGTYHGLVIGASAADTQIVGGRFGDSPSVAGNRQGWGIFVNNNASNLRIVGANVQGNTTGAINLGTGLTGLEIEACAGYNNQAAASSVTVTASPFTYNNTSGAKQSLTITGGTVSNITLGGDSIASATGQQVIVPIGGSVVITYTVAPTVKAQRL